jgi:hypothetical protein
MLYGGYDWPTAAVIGALLAFGGWLIHCLTRDVHCPGCLCFDPEEEPDAPAADPEWEKS